MRCIVVPVRRKFWSMSFRLVSVHNSATENRKNSIKIAYFMV